MSKEIEFIHNLRGKGRPQILLIGNGVERAYGSASWDKLIDLIDVHKFNKEVRDEINKLPFPVDMSCLQPLKMHRQFFYRTIWMPKKSVWQMQ